MKARAFTPDPGVDLHRVIKDRSRLGEPSVRVVEGGILLPLMPARGSSHELWRGGVSDAMGSFVAGHRVHPVRDHKLNISESYPLSEAPAHRGEVILYGGGGSLGHFGHFLTEGLARLWWLFEKNDESIRIAFTAPDLTIEHPSMQLLVHAGIDPQRILLVREPTQFSAVVVPEPAFYLGSGEYHPGHSTSVYDAIRDRIRPSSAQKVYLTRSSFHDPVDRLREYGEPMIEDLYRSQGFEVISPERLAVSEQIALVAGASELASTVGTLSHWILLARDGIKQDAILRHPSSLGMEGQWGMSAMRSAELSVVSTTLDMLPGSRWAGIVSHTATREWAHFVRERFGVDVPLSDIGSSLPQYVRDWVDLLTNLPEEQLGFIPDWSVADFIEHFSRQLIGVPLDVDVRERLHRRFSAS